MGKREEYNTHRLRLEAVLERAGRAPGVIPEGEKPEGGRLPPPHEFETADAFESAIRAADAMGATRFGM